MKKYPLHLQIFVALILAIIYGIIFPTNYILTEKSFKQLVRIGIPPVYIENLITLKGDIFSSQQEFIDATHTVLPKETAIKYQSQIIKAAYHNKPVKSVSWMGDIFLRALRMIIIPLIFSSLISGVTGIGTGSNLGRLGLKTISYYILTSTIAIITGLVLVNILQPGIGADINLSQHVEGLVEKQKGLGETLIHIVPENIFISFQENDMLSVIFFAILFGYFITRVKEEYRNALIKAFNAIFEVMMKITMFIIIFTPFGIFSIVSKVVADQNDLINLVSRMGIYMLTVFSALLFHFFLTLPMIVRFIGKARPYRHMKNMSPALFTAFSTASSGATLPLTINAVEQNSGVSNKISSFTLPLGATINMDGTALYECIATLFIAQAYGVEMSFIQQMIIVLTALLRNSYGRAGHDYSCAHRCGSSAGRCWTDPCC